MMIRTVIRTAQKGHSVAGGGIRWSARRLLSSVNDQFEQAVNAVPTLSEEPGDETKLKMYALYSQAKKGPCTTPAPGMFDLVGKAKHKAWLSLKDMSQDNAKEEYVRVVSGLFGGKLPGPKASQWDPPAGAATTAVMPETKSEAAKPAAEAVAAAESLPAGWVKKFNEKKGKHYYYNAETKTSQWDPPPGTVTASAAPSSGSGTATTGKPTEVLPAGWVKKYNEKKAKDYYYHAETKTSQWAAPEGTVVTSDSNAGGSSAQATSSDAAEILPAGWVKKFNEKKGKDYYFHAATKTSQWSAPEGTVKGQAVAGSTSSKEVSTTKSDWNCFIWLHQRTDGAESIVLSSLRVHGVGNGATVTVKPVVPPESQAVKPEISFQVSKLSRLSFNTVSAGTQFCDNTC
jgi:acyl-CoA-binding protein